MTKNRKRRKNEEEEEELNTTNSKKQNGEILGYVACLGNLAFIFTTRDERWTSYGIISANRSVSELKRFEDENSVALRIEICSEKLYTKNYQSALYHEKPFLSFIAFTIVQFDSRTSTIRHEHKHHFRFHTSFRWSTTRSNIHNRHVKSEHRIRN